MRFNKLSLDNQKQPLKNSKTLREPRRAKLGRKASSSGYSPDIDFDEEKKYSSKRKAFQEASFKNRDKSRLLKLSRMFEPKPSVSDDSPKSKHTSRQM